MSDLVTLLGNIVDDMTKLAMRVADHDRRFDGMVRHGKVTDVDAKKQLARIEVAERDGDVVKSPWIPYAQFAGAYKSHTPPVKGQQLTLFAPNADLRQGMLMPFTFSDQNKSPSDKPDEHVDIYGDKWKWVRKADLNHFTLDKSSIEVKPASIVEKVGSAEAKIEDGKITLSVDGSSVTITSSKIVLKSKKIVTDGETYLGSEEAEAQVELTTGPATMAFGI